MRTSWMCTVCGKSGVIRHPKTADEVDLTLSIERAHEKVSRGCGFDPDVFVARSTADGRPARRAFP